MMIDRLPPLIAGVCLLIYWGTVVAKALRFARKEAHDANVIPREPLGRWLRLVWVPVIVAWIVQPWVQVAAAEVVSLGRIVAFHGAAICMLATVATFSCWREMGKSWRIGIDPGESTALVFSGPFRFVRHPIYALSIVLVLGTLATTPTLLMLTLAVLHTGLLQFEAHREEAYLLSKHGDSYAQYRRRVGRFVPRLLSRS
jgi:protein-S-isoprenylcysteine O-methyltransferase Ste14